MIASARAGRLSMTWLTSARLAAAAPPFTSAASFKASDAKVIIDVNIAPSNFLCSSCSRSACLCEPELAQAAQAGWLGYHSRQHPLPCCLRRRHGAEARVEDLSDRLRPRRLRLRLRRDPGVKDGELIRVDANADGEPLTRRGSASAFLC